MLPIKTSSTTSLEPFDARAIFAGSVVDIAGSLHSEALTYIAAGLAWFVIGTNPETTVAFYLFNIGRGLFFTGLGAYFAGRMARTNPLQHALVAGSVSLLVSVGLRLAQPEFFLSWEILLAVLLTMPVALVGGLLSRNAQVPTRD